MSSSELHSLGLTEVVANLENGILIVTLKSSRKMNSFTEKMSHDLIRVFRWGDVDDRVRVIVLTADPKVPAFCAGADMQEILKGSALLGRQEENEDEHRDPGGQVALAIYNNRKITIAAVNGHASGSGFTSLQLPFDFRFIWAGAHITLPFLRLGILPESTSTYLLSRLVGESRATSILLSNAKMQPSSPNLSSLYQEILPNKDDVLPAALAFAKMIAINSAPVSVSYTKGLLHHPGTSIEENHLLDSRAIKRRGASKDGAEGLKAFMQRRSPNFPDTVSSESSSWYPWWKPRDVSHPNKSKL
ncbi:hypothetical protein GYMLUDRAFT_995083 [Collybiopsis luxurians FD-317 M1]|uniref:Uncharacterized protein n=1 Tax=Collybiopsis luxurians FD-317 M1 TaxID=944289 RepID=A0A0D0CSF2_9AGAR|nr:hypothetical protein GYMLUDRAFT_995083 [Collybiopsis luxurians FD-317 M1]